MSLVDLRAFTFPSSLNGDEWQTAMLLSQADSAVSGDEAAAVQGILREVASLLNKTPAALGSMRRRLGIAVDCLIAVADEIDGDCDLETHFAGYLGPKEDECEPDEHTYGFEPNLATTEHEDASGQYAGQHIGLWFASQLDEPEEACEDEGAHCDDEGCPNDNGMAEVDGGAEQGFHCGGFSARSIS